MLSSYKEKCIEGISSYGGGYADSRRDNGIAEGPFKARGEEAKESVTKDIDLKRAG